MRTKSFLWSAALTLLGVACGGDDGSQEKHRRSISGTVTAEGLGALQGVTVTAGDLTDTTDAAGAFALHEVPVGNVTVAFEANNEAWEDTEIHSTVTAGGTVTADVELAIAMRALATDLALAEAYNTTFDWTTDKVSIVYVGKPTRGALERGMFWHNPAFYVDPSAEAQITPAKRPDTDDPSSFDFLITHGASTDTQALIQTSVVDSIDETPLTTAEQDNGVMWEPAVEGFLLDWNLDAATPLYLAGVAVKSQKWGATPTLAPQTIEMVYVHEGDVWVKVVFQGFVDTASSITDSDGDGLVEVFGKITSTLSDSAVYSQLKDTYMLEEHRSKELRNILDAFVDDLYSRSNPSVVSTIAVPYQSTELHATFEWPFAVVGHGEPETAGYVVNILLVAGGQ
jgi:hypothetical protein